MTDLLRLSVPLTLWLAVFSALYGLEGLVCSDRWPWDAVAGRRALLALAALALVLQVGLLVALRSRRLASPSPFVRRVSVTLAAAALAATGWTLAPVAATSLCL